MYFMHLCEIIEHRDGEKLAKLVVPQDAGDELVHRDAVVPVSVHLPPAALHQLVLTDVLLAAGLAHQPRHVLDQLHELRLGDHTVVINIKYTEYLNKKS